MVEKTDFEIGEEPIEIERRPRSDVVVGVRLSAEEADRLQKLADRDGTTLSRVAYQIVSSYLAHVPVDPLTGTSH